MIDPDLDAPGSFYLGRAVDPATRKPTGAPLLYDSRDLVTHAVCVGMTGSGKTGLCLAMIEEAALDGVPAIVIDPKGDLGNLLLTFPALAPADFRPWIDPAEAARKGVEPDAHAADEAARWTAGLAGWGQDGARIARLRAAADFAIYTPGSTAGRPVSILGSFAAPDAATRDDPELIGEQIGAAATGLLTLLGIDADPVRSREHVLLSTIFQAAWKAGEDLDLAAIIGRIQKPSVTRVGVLDLETFYPAADRFELATRLNHLLAAPAFAAWLEGEPLDIGRMLRTGDGRPGVAIVSIAHLGDAERMFFVTMLLHAVLGWMRKQSGTSSLRAILYMDEIAGYVPPVANPPSKGPLLTLLKQGRAFGLGCLLATQNPVDLDYKGLSNAGTWFLGRLQTERDKARVIDGLEGISAGGGPRFERSALERTLAGLGSRVFLMNDVHEDGPVVFETRWVMSYLRGPLTRAQIKALMDARRSPPALAPAASAPGAAASAASPVHVAPSGRGRPVLAPAIEQLVLPVHGAADAAAIVYRPALLASAHLRYVDARAAIDLDEDLVLLVPLAAGPEPLVWAGAQKLRCTVDMLHGPPLAGARFEDLPAPAAAVKSWTAWKKESAAWLARSWRVPLWKSPSTGALSRPGEHENDFRGRLALAGREARDTKLEALRSKVAPKVAALQEKRRKAMQALEREAEQAKEQGFGTALAVGATIFGALLGGRSLSRATSAARSAGRTAKQASDVTRARETVAAVDVQLAALEQTLRARVEAIAAEDPAREPLEVKELRARKADVVVHLVALVWAPHRAVGGALGGAPEDGRLVPAWS